jgi:hypothetical protein
MKALLLLTLASLASCSVNWKQLGTKAGQAALDATAPIILDELTTKPAPKQPKNVQP